MKTLYFDLFRRDRFWVLLLLYAIELTASLWMAYELRFDFMVDPSCTPGKALRSALDRSTTVDSPWIIPATDSAPGIF